MIKILVFQLLVISIQSISGQSSNPTLCQNRYGNSLNGTCKLVDDCTGAALVGNCSNGFICCIPDKAPISIPENLFITRARFFKFVNKTTRTQALYNYFVESLNSVGANEIYKAAAYFSQLIDESNYFKKLESGIIDNDLDVNLGNNETQDGTRYQGRGAILLRGKKNYYLAKSSLSVDIIQNPELVAFPSLAFKIAAWFWLNNAYVITSNSSAKKTDLGILADGTYHNFTLLTYSLTSNLQKLKDRTNLYNSIVQETGYGTIKRGFGLSCKIGSNEGFSVPICLIGENKPYCGCEGEYEMRSCPYGFLSNNKCRGSSVLKCCVEKCSTSLDIVILMDSSGSIGIDNFQKEKDFVFALLDKVKIGENDTRVSVLNYNSIVYDVATFNTTQTNETIKNLINRIVYRGGGTNTYDALRRANDFILQEENGMRSIKSGIPKVVIVITDGASANLNKTLTEAQRIKDRGLSVISVGVGNINRIELIGIASTPADQYYADDFDKIKLILSGLSRTTCQQPATVSIESNVKATVEKNTYRYYRYSIKDALNYTNGTLDSFTIELAIYDGETELFYSFEEETPKSDDEFLPIEDTGPDTNFIENKTRIERSVRNDIDEAIKTKLYKINRPQDGKNDILYFSVKGLSELNEYTVFVHSKVVSNPETTSNEIMDTSQTTTMDTSQTTTTKSSSNTFVNNLFLFFLAFILIIIF